MQTGEEADWQEDAFAELVRMAVEKDPSLASRASATLAKSKPHTKVE